MNPFTGGCHYAGDCLKYKTSCGACPQLGSDTEKDLSNHIWKQKYDVYKNLSINIVTPSRWLGKCAARSKLFSPFPVNVIPNGFPIDIFKPHPKAEIRKELDIPESAKVILFGAESVVNARKGFAYLIEALNRLSVEDGHKRVILTFGSLPEGVKITSRCPVYNLGSVANENQLALAYSAADVFVIPSIEDNLPNTVIEAMACGIPVVGFDIGGIPDMVDHKKNGYLVKPKNIGGLIEGIDWVISSSESGTNFSERCREKVEKEYSLEVQAKSYYELYKGIVNQHFPLVENTYSKVRTLNQQGENLFSKGDLEGALDFFIKTLDIDPNSAIAHNNLGVLYYQQGSKEKAIEHYRKAAEFQPENITFQKNLADFYYVELGRVEEAMQIYIKVLNANPEDIESLLILGHICVALKKFDDAKDFYSRILIIEPWNKDAMQFFQKLEEYQLSVIGNRLGSEDIETASKEYLVSAIVSTYNSERFIRGCLDDLENQTIADRLEIVVVNSGSQENEEAVIKEFQEKYSNIKYIKTNKRETVYAAWNRGIKASTGKYITNANTDDRHRKDAFEVIINILEKQPEIALVYADVIITETENETFENCTAVGYFSWMNWKREDLLNKGCFMGPQPMWRRDVHDEYGYFDDSLVTSGDYEFWLRISQTNTFLHLPIQLGLYLRSPGSIEHSNKEKQRDENNKIFKMYSEPNSSEKNIRCIGTDLAQASAIKIDKRRESKLKAFSPDIQISIIVPTSRQQKYIKNCVESIQRHTSQLHEIIFVDNGATKGTRKWLNQNIKENSNYIMTKCPKDAGSASIYNQGIKVSTGENILLLSNDVVVTKDWLSGMIECMKRIPDAGVIGPMSNISSGTQKVLTTDNVSINQLDKIAESFMTKNRYRRISSNSIDGFCMLFNRDLVEKIGLFDEQFDKNGYENEDFCLRALLAGRKNLIAGDVYVHQQNRKTFNRNKKYFNAKWNKADTQSPLGEKYLALTAVEKGNELYQKGRIDNAVEKLLEGIGLSPNDKRTYYALAEILIHAKNYKDATDVLNEMPPGEQDAKRLELIGYCKEGMKLYDEAHDYANQALSL
ncbi:MAG: glycosyltransferase, partial [Deltaproteobacteria bacterium]|nr:glycosyltransferase [Deltaproteobacteria bacterium]